MLHQVHRRRCSPQRAVERKIETSYTVDNHTMDLLTYSAAKAEAEKQRLLAEKYKAEVETYKAEVIELKKQLQESHAIMERASAAGMTVDKYLRIKEIDRQERAALQEESEYGRRMRLQKS